MGMSIDYIANKWEKQKIELKRPKLVGKCIRNSENYEIWDHYYHLISIEDSIFYQENICEKNYNSKRYELHKQKSKSFIDKIKNDKPSLIKDWFLMHENSLISYDDDLFFAYEGIETIKQSIWKPLSFVHVNEDGKLLTMAIANLSQRYGVSLSSVMLSEDSLLSYEEGTSEGNRIDQIINMNKKFLADILEFALSNIEKQEDDEFFEERLPRLHLLLEALKEDGVFVYSV